MYHYFRRVFSKPRNANQVQRTISGLDKKHIESGNYIYKKFKDNHLPEIAESMRLLNIYGPGTANRRQQHNFVDIWSGTLWGEIKTLHPSYQKPCCPSVLSKENNPPPSSQKSSSFPPSKSSP